MAKKKAKTKTVSKRTPKSFVISKQNKIVLGSLIMLVSIALFFSFASFFFTWKNDQSLLVDFANRNVEASNLLNKFGAAVSHFFIYKGFGISSFILVFLTFLSGLHLFLSLNAKKLISKWIWGLLFMIWFSVFLSLVASSAPLLGGLIGYEVNDFLKAYVGTLGVILILIFGFVFILAVRFKLTPDRLLHYFNNQKEKISKDFESDQKETSIETQEESRAVTIAPKPVVSETKEVQEKSLETEITFDSNSLTVTPTKKENDTSDFIIETPIEEEIVKEDLQMEVKTVVEKEETGNIADKLVADFGEFDPRLELSNYTFPHVDLLDNHGVTGGNITINQEELEENKNRIVETLKNYKIGIAKIKATIGPTVTLYEIVPEAGVRISKIKNLEDDIALSLAALGIRIIAPIPGKGTIGIEVPNKSPSIVPMRAVIASPNFKNAEMELPIAFGKTISNETFVVDLAKMPHLLMAGATGQGKSVGLNAILASLLYKKHPAEVKFVLVDPKKVELTLFNKIERHFLAKLPDSGEAIITDNTKVINTLNSLCIEMDDRYELLKNAMVRNIKEYNTKFKVRKLNPNDGHRFLPYIVLVVDEFADLIITAGKEVEMPIARLAQLARAIGIHLIIATQRPSVNVITGIIKANFPARVAFRVTSKIDSRTILDGSGADQLIGRGDMLYTQGNDLIRIQCAFVDTPEVEKITEFIGSQRAYASAYLLPEYSGEDSGTSLDVDIADRDKLFREAAELIVIAQQGSASLLQRKLKLGYNRAGRLIDQLEAAGIVGPFEGSKARQVLITDIVALDQLLNNE